MQHLRSNAALLRGVSHSLEENKRKPWYQLAYEHIRNNRGAYTQALSTAVKLGTSLLAAPKDKPKWQNSSTIRFHLDNVRIGTQNLVDPELVDKVKLVQEAIGQAMEYINSKPELYPVPDADQTTFSEDDPEWYEHDTTIRFLEALRDYS